MNQLFLLITPINSHQLVLYGIFCVAVIRWSQSCNTLLIYSGLKLSRIHGLPGQNSIGTNPSKWSIFNRRQQAKLLFLKNALKNNTGCCYFIKKSVQPSLLENFRKIVASLTNSYNAIKALITKGAITRISKKPGASNHKLTVCQLTNQGRAINRKEVQI